MQMIADFLEWLLGEEAKAIVLTIGAIGSLLIGLVALFEYLRRRQRDREIEVLRVTLKQKQDALDEQQREADRRDEKFRKQHQELENLRTAVLGSEGELWRIHKPQYFSGYFDWIARRRPIIITVANLKGGVGKTTLTTSLAAFFDAEANKRVLVVDLDYQGSLSNMMLSASRETDVASQVNHILDGSTQPGNYEEVSVHLDPMLPKTWLIPAYYALAPLENRLMVDWLMQESSDDIRYRLARFLSHEHIQRDFDIVLIDVPPRLTTGTINALCASTHLLVPTVMDRTSAEAVGSFLRAARNLKATLNPGLELLGIVGLLTHQQHGLHETEERAKVRILEQLPQVWGPNQIIFNRHIPRRMEFSRAAGEGIAYLNGTGEVREWMNTLGGEIRVRIGG